MDSQDIEDTATPSRRKSTEPMTAFTSKGNDDSDSSLMINILRGLRDAPLSRADFQAFLDSERSGELSKFFVEAEKHEQKAVEKTEEAVNIAEFITEEFIKTNSKNEINISDRDRRQVLNLLSESKENAYDPKLFQPAKNEVIKMLNSDKFQRFLHKQLETNINDTEVRRRFRVGLMFCTFSAVLLGLLMWIQTLGHYPFDSRWWRLVIAPFLFWGYGLLLSAQARVCQGLAAKCVRMKERDSWFTAFKKGEGIQHVVDNLALSSIQQKAKSLSRKTLVAFFISMAIILVVPPGYGIGAPG